MRVLIVGLLILPFAGCLEVPGGDPAMPGIVFDAGYVEGDLFVRVALVNDTYDWRDFEVVGCTQPTGIIFEGTVLKDCVRPGTIVITYLPTNVEMLRFEAEPAEIRDPVTWVVPMQNNRFVGGSLTIQVGDTVEWVHEDGFTPHDVRSKDNSTEDFYSGDMYQFTPGFPDTFSYTFEQVGDNAYYCTYHAGTMDNVVRVQERFDQTP